MEHEDDSDISCNRCKGNNSLWLGKGSGKIDIDKDSKMVLDAALLNTQHYNVRMEGKVE